MRLRGGSGTLPEYSQLRSVCLLIFSSWATSRVVRYFIARVRVRAHSRAGTEEPSMKRPALAPPAGRAWENPGLHDAGRASGRGIRGAGAAFSRNEGPPCGGWTESDSTRMRFRT